MPSNHDVFRCGNVLESWHVLFVYALTAGLLWTSAICAVLSSASLAGGLLFSINIVACLSYLLMIVNTVYTGMDVAQYNIQVLIRLIDWVITFPLIQIEILFLWGYKVDHSSFNQMALLLTSLGFLVVLIQAARQFSRTVAHDVTLSTLYFFASIFFFSIQLIVIWMLERRACNDDFSCNAINFSFVLVWLFYPALTVIMDWFQPPPGSTLFFALDALTCLLDVYSKAFLATVVAIRAQY